MSWPIPRIYDYGVSGVQDMLTSWIPLMEIPPRIGALAVQPGGHLGPPGRPRPLSATEPGWATTSYEPGDVLVFHCLTPHAALPNRGSTLRISGDFRWQRSDEPAPAELVLGPAGRPPEMFSRLFGRERWWEPVPAGLALRPRAQMITVPPGPSRLIPVHPRLAALAATPRYRPLTGRLTTGSGAHAPRLAPGGLPVRNGRLGETLATGTVHGARASPARFEPCPHTAGSSHVRIPEVPAVNAFLWRSRRPRKVSRSFISSFYAIRPASTERGILLAFGDVAGVLIHNSSTGTWV
jgi:hypothetical protein